MSDNGYQLSTISICVRHLCPHGSLHTPMHFTLFATTFSTMLSGHWNLRLNSDRCSSTEQSYLISYFIVSVRISLISRRPLKRSRSV